jgi:hypothetical protein
MRLQAVSEGVEAEAEAEATTEKRRRVPKRARRVSGAAKSFLPNDKMCVMCQFLTERIQLDLTGRVGSAMAHPYGGYSYGGVSTNMMAGVATTGKSFLEITDADGEDEADEETDEETDEEADEAEVEEEADEETEEEEGDDVLLQVAEADESDEEEADEGEEEAEEEEASITDETEEEASASEWATPEYTALVETAAKAAGAEEDATTQTPQYIDAVYQTTEDAATEEETAEVDAGTTDVVEPSFFESAAVAGTAGDAAWTTPAYTAAEQDASAAAPAEMVDAEMTSFVEVNADASWVTPQYDEAAAAATAGTKVYARVLQATEEDEAEAEEEPALVEAASDVKFFAPRIVYSRSGKGKFFHTPRRYRASDAQFARPRWNRHGHHTAHRAMAAVIGGAAFRQAEHSAYDRLETYCSTRLPESYGRYCRPMLRNFRHITEGLRYGDRVGQVCMQVNLCKKTSYIAQSPHVRHG